jgi:hypothetical protein
MHTIGLGMASPPGFGSWQTYYPGFSHAFLFC